jgi:spore coat protein A
MNRRTLLKLAGGAGAAAAIGVPLADGLTGTGSTGALLESRLRLPEPYQLPLPIPPVLTPVRRDAGGDHYEITQRAGTAEILPGVATRVWGYDGMFPGPTVVSESGRPTIVRHHNSLPVPVVVHLHGGHTPASDDGFPTDLLLPAGPAPAHDHDHGGLVTQGFRDYTYPMRQPAATLWYHDHRMDFTGPSVWRGLAGFHLVRDAAERRLGLPGGTRDIPIMIADRSFDTDGSLLYPGLDPGRLGTPGVTGPFRGGVLGDVITANGAAWPVAEVPRVRHRLRLLNGSNARRYRLALEPSGPGFLVVGTDGGLITSPVRRDTLDLAPGQRCDVVVDFARYPEGRRVLLRNEFGHGPTSHVMRFLVGDAADDPSRVPDRLAPPPLSDPPAVTRTLHFGLGAQHTWTINGRYFDPRRADVRPKPGTTELWRLTSDFDHPVHLHLAQFEVVSRGLSGPGPDDLGLRDTIDLRASEQATIRVAFGDYPGRYVFHCHNLEHEDMAMMGTMLVG